jgi:tetratricopeptide (TPR) repeat protein
MLPLLIVSGYTAAGLLQASYFADPLQLWSRAASRAPANPRAHAALGAVLLERGMSERAAEELALALRLDPRYPEPYLDLAAAYARLGRLDEAVAVARRRVALVPDAGSWLNLGAFLLGADRFSEALAPLRRAVELSPADPDARLDLALCLLGLRRWDAARALLEPAARDPRTAAKALAGLGDLWAGQGDTRRSIRSYEDALRRNPAQGDAARKLARSRLSSAQRAEAVGLCDAALRRLGETLAALRAHPRDEDRGMLSLAQRTYEELKASRDRIASSPVRRQP